MVEIKRDVLLTTYLTKYVDPQSGKRVMANDSRMMKLAITAAEVGHPCVVFHDQLSDEFCEQYPQTEFVKVSNKTMLSCNDYRLRRNARVLGRTADAYGRNIWRQKRNDFEISGAARFRNRAG